MVFSLGLAATAQILLVRVDQFQEPAHHVELLPLAELTETLTMLLESVRHDSDEHIEYRDLGEERGAQEVDNHENVLHHDGRLHGGI